VTSDDDLITTGRAAALLHCTRQHVADLCDRGELPHVKEGNRRLIRRRDILEHMQPSLRPEEERSWWLHGVVASKVLLDPEGLIGLARANLDKMRRVHGERAWRWFDLWQQILDQGPNEVYDVLTSRSPFAVEMRQNTPFAGALTDDEARRIRQAWRAQWRERHRGPAAA
jgi:excisionase family DNA binding protein